MEISDVIQWVGRLAAIAKTASQLPLQEELVKLRSELVAIQNDLIDKGQLIRRLEDTAKLRPNVVLNRSAYWEWNESKRAYEVHPFCTRCFEVDGLAVHLQDKPLGKDERHSFACPECKQVIPSGCDCWPPNKDPQGNSLKQ